ncbi:endolytic transglycosylase MltG [Kistimonas scapharcae]|uniref:Endolytic murein transglycosylase n=1 Tax=Kistimonas scapharcae TaxID=1036133 RepID=A0ABP8V9G9_9GAMM
MSENNVPRKPLFYVLLMLLAAALLVLLSWRWLQAYLDEPVNTLEEGTVFVVNAGESFSRVSRRLEERGILRLPDVFRLYARVIGEDTGLRAGEYLVKPETTVAGLLELLTSGRVILHSATLIEGRTLAENLAMLSENKKLVFELTGLNGQEILKKLEFSDASAEGMFFPDTYYFEAGDTDTSILRRAYLRMQEVLAKEWARKASDLPYQSPYEALIMASLIERETGVPEERGQIAGVFVRRLQKGMRLQTDPSVIYGLGEAYQGNLTRKHLRTYSPYNTYRIKGLPPTPIALAGRESIRAALHPEAGNTFYFVARGDGSHKFSRTLAEHNAAVKKYQLTRRKGYRSSPLVTTE